VEGAAAYDNLTRFEPNQAVLLTIGAGAMRAELLSLLRGGRFESSSDQTTHGFDGHIFHHRQVDIQPRPLVAKSAATNNFSPLFGEIAEITQVFLG
jgi:hypothetical protein